ncbi:ACT domain-containing protein [Bradyrhizobium sp. AUGA SZCCT0222]|uniref:ACT domain-containing protein n=1 Tax=Bradyrhizobium sp. AUGA SZCCT0222 TaxID=2807668 RepID=UPI001BA4E0A3|nr:ACT domain-containing protein [Bradyrhizobium sp. AUGA SZCCT0222]
MPGERDLAMLLQNMKPEMHDGVFVFCSIPADKEVPAALRPVHLFREREGTTLVMRREEAESAGLPHQFASRLITLTVHSSLEAVGFLAAITGRLAQAGISVNAVSAYYHDHLFVPEHRADEALQLLQDMSKPNSTA